MFKEPYDINACLSPLDTDKVELNAASFEPQADILRLLFNELEAVFSTLSNEKTAFLSSLEENGMDETIASGYEVFKRNYLPKNVEEDAELEEIYKIAIALFNEGQTATAIQLFSLIAAPVSCRMPGLLALAACACKQTSFKQAFELAEACIMLDDKHPRSHLIAGYSALKLKDFKNAKRYLALTARLARHNIEHRAEQRSAQKELLMLQFS